MKRLGQFIALGSYLALAGAPVLGTGCTTTANEQVAADTTPIEIRFHEGTEAREAQQLLGLLPFSMLAPAEYTDVQRIVVDVTYAQGGQPFALNFALTRYAADSWRGELPFLPRDVQFRFAARALDENNAVIFSGESLAILTTNNQGVQIPLAPIQNNRTLDMPRLFRMVYPEDMIAGQQVQFIFTVEANAGETIEYRIVHADPNNTAPVPFSPAAGSVTMGNSVADFITLYTAPDITSQASFDYQVVITSDSALGAVSIASDFTTTVVPRSQGIAGVTGVRPSVLFNPVILSMTANGTATPGSVSLTVQVSDDSPQSELAYQWSFAPAAGTPTATFANNGQGNPTILEGYTVDHQGTISVAVTDGNNGTTTLNYRLTPDQFAEFIDHGAVNGLTKIVSGAYHTCALTGTGRVRCWGRGELGQLGYGNGQNVGHAANALPYMAGEIPLPAAYPVTQLVAGNNHTCALMDSGLVYCWGQNDYGQLGYGNTNNLGDGEPVYSFGFVSLGGLATRIAAGGDHTCAILQSGALRCWGRNDFGQLGYGHTDSVGDNENVFDRGNIELGLPATVSIKDVAVGGYHTCALLSNGNVRCWGRADYRQHGYPNLSHLGDNEQINNLADVALPGPVRKVVGGDLHTCALLENGALRCWGWNGNLNADVVTGAPQVTDVAAGYRHTCALLSNGQLKCWGVGDYGGLGYGNQNSQLTPPASGIDLDGTSAYQISAGTYTSCALRSNGTARCWGLNNYGQLGIGNTTARFSPAASSDIQVFQP